MATPSTLADALEILNTAYTALGYGVGNNPAEITAENLETIGALPESQINPLFHEINRILSERWFSNSLNESAKGLFRFLIRNDGGHGFGIIDRFVNLIESTPYPTSGADIAADLVTAASSPVDVKRFTEPYQPGRYKGTIRRQELRKFLTPEGLVRYVTWITNNLFQSAELGIMQAIAGMIKTAIEAEQVVAVTNVDMNTENGLVQLVEDMMTAVDAFHQPTTLFNVAERLINTPDNEDVVIITTPSRWNRVRAHLLSDRYHLDQLYVDGRVIFAPEGTDLGVLEVIEDGETVEKPVQFVICDARAWVIEITTWELRPFEVSNMNYLNEFLHVEGVKGSVPVFSNAIAFAGEYGAFHNGDEPAPVEESGFVILANPSSVMSYVVKDADGNPVSAENTSFYADETEYTLLYNVPSSSGTIDTSALSKEVKGGGTRLTLNYVITDGTTGEEDKGTPGTSFTLPEGIAFALLRDIES